MRRSVRRLLLAAAVTGALLPGSVALGAAAPIVNTTPDDACSKNVTKPSIVFETKVQSPGVVDPGPVGVWEKACSVENEALKAGSPSRLPIDVRYAEPGDLIRIRDTRTYSKSDKAFMVTFKGTGLVFEKELSGKQSCGNTGICSGWATTWNPAAITPQTMGYFVVATVNQKGEPERHCFPTLRSSCPEKF